MSHSPRLPDRRTVLGVGGGAAAAALLAACSSSPATPSAGSNTAAGSNAGAGSNNAAGSTAATGPGAAAATELAAVSDIPDGGALVVGKVVLARKGNTVTGHSAVCTHQGCLVMAASGDQVNCPCHGSQFAASTGAVLNPPAVDPLPEVAVTVKAGKVYQA